MYHKCYIVPEAETLQEKSAPSLSKIPRKLRLNNVTKWKLTIPAQSDETKMKYKLNDSDPSGGLLINYRNITKEKNNMETGDGSRVIMEADKGNCFVVID